MNAILPLPDLAERLLATGWLPGAPPQVTEATKRIDRQICRLRRCPRCKRRGLAYEPYHRDDRYKVVGRCETCNRQEEF